MSNVTKVLLNLLLFFLILFSSVILYSENSSALKKDLTQLFQDELKNTLDVDVKIKKTNIKWIGLNPIIKMENTHIGDATDKILLDIPSSEIHIDILDTLKNQELSIGKIVINDTVLDFKYGKNEIIVNRKKLQVNSDSDVKRNIPKIILNNSDIKITNLINKQTISLRANNLLASYQNNVVKVYSNFMHQASPNPMTVQYEGEVSDDTIKSKIFLSGNSIKVPYLLLPEQLRKLKSDQMSLRVWLYMNGKNVVRVSGNIATDRLSMTIGKSLFTLTDVNSDLLFVKDKQSETLGLMRMNYVINNKNISNNQIVLNKDNKKNIRIFIKKNDRQLIKRLLPLLEVDDSDILSQLLSSDMRDIQLHLSNKGSLDYYSLSINDASIDIESNHSINNIDAEVYGTPRGGMISISNLSVNEKEKNLLSNVSGEISFKLRGRSVYFSSSSLTNDQNYILSFSGHKTSKLPSIKIQISSNLKEIMPYLISSDLRGNIEYEGKINANVYYHNGTFFSKSFLEDLMIKYLDNIYISSPKIKLFTTSNFISSDKINLSINKNEFTSRIRTSSNSTSHKFILSSTGSFDTKILNKSFDISELVKGETKIKSVTTYDYKKNIITSYVTTNLNGVSLNIIEPFNKNYDEDKNFTLRYQHFPKISYPLSVTLEKHEFKFRNDEDYIYSNIISPIARGFFKYPTKSESENIAIGSFEYIDTSYFKSDGIGQSLPKMEIKSKYVKTSKAVLDNVHLVLTPEKNYVSIDKLNFENLHLQMQSSGKWYRDKNEITEIDADIKSSNLGQALTGLGYVGVLKGGDLNAKFKAQWRGSPEDFSFSNSTGELKFTIKNGQINELDKRTQVIGQVLGLFSISSIPKRLSLDFSDFFSRGLKFDDLTSNIILDNGIADTKRMLILGSFGEMRLSGKSNLVNETHDQTLIFIPDLSSTSLVTGAVLGGPIGAAASIFYDRLLKEFGLDTNKIAGIEYSIKGPWKNPEIKVTQSFKPILN